MAPLESVAIGERAYSETMPRRPESAREARLLVSSALRAWGFTEAEDAAHNVVTELVANAITHARRESIRVNVTRANSRTVRVAVVDLSRQLPQQRRAGEDDECGRGLALVAALTDGRWGVEPLSWGKRVYADLDVPEEKPGE